MQITVNQSLINRFFAKVQLHTDADGCDIWLASTDRYGYGKISGDGRTLKAHQVGYAIKNGSHDQALLRHTCNNPRCVRPDHLIPGTAEENYRDIVAAGHCKLKSFKGGK